MQFCFGDIVIVEGYLIGVIVKSWVSNNQFIEHEVYVREYNKIIRYKEDDIKRYMVRHKELNEEELEYQKQAECPFITCDEIKQFQKYINNKGEE